MLQPQPCFSERYVSIYYDYCHAICAISQAWNHFERADFDLDLHRLWPSPSTATPCDFQNAHVYIHMKFCQRALRFEHIELENLGRQICNVPLAGPFNALPQS